MSIIIDGVIEEGRTAKTTDGPFGFGYAVSVDIDIKQCFIHEHFSNSLKDGNAKKCSMNPKDCEENGFSISVWEKTVFDNSIFNESLYNESTDPKPEIKYVLSTGGDTEGHPGVAIYHSGLHLVAVVSTGNEYWELKVIGPLHNNSWNNIGLRWESTDSGNTGLELYVNLEMVGHVMHSNFAFDPPKMSSKVALDEMMLGCHRTSSNDTYGGYNGAAYDELAIWTHRLNDSDKWFFLGGYQKDFAGISTEEFQSILNNVDLEDPAQQAAAVDILSQMTRSEPEPSPSPVSVTVKDPTSSTRTNSIQKRIAEPSPSATPTEKAVEKASPKVNKIKLEDLAKMSDIMDTMTNVTKVKEDITEDELKTYMKLVDVASNILNNGSAAEWVGLLDEEDNPGASKTVTRLEKWTMQLIKNTKFNETQPIEYIKNTDNIIMRLDKIPVHDMKANQFYTTPVYSEDMKDKWSMPMDKVRVPTGMFSKNDTCKDRPVSVMSSIYSSYDEFAPTVVSPATLNPSSPNDLDSRVVSVEIHIDPDPMYQSSQDPCFPNTDYLTDNPIRITLEHKLKMISLRKLQFHEHEIVTEIKRRYCVWWNPSLSDFGAWDGKGCRILETKEDYTKCACDHVGTFAIMAEKIDPIEVPEEASWLSITKYVGYGFSTLFLVIYILVIAFSGDLKEQFHLMGLNLAVAVLLGSMFMIISDFIHHEDDRHICTLIGSLIHFFYLAAGAWMALLGHASFKAITAGIIGGRIKSYSFIGWGLAFISLGLSYIFFLHDLGTDPRCFISWNNNAKYVFFAPQMTFVALSFFFGMVVLCNMSTPALRKDNLVDDYGSFCSGASFLMIFFDITWSFGLVAYVRFGFKDPDFFPIFQVLNSWTGVLIFLFIGICSNRFRMVLAGQSKLRKQMLLRAAFGRDYKDPDKEQLNSPEDQNSHASSAGSSPTQIRPPSTASTVALDFPSTPTNTPASNTSLVSGRSGSRTLHKTKMDELMKSIFG